MGKVKDQYSLESQMGEVMKTYLMEYRREVYLAIKDMEDDGVSAEEILRTIKSHLLKNEYALIKSNKKCNDESIT